jgi:hypothetical protein
MLRSDHSLLGQPRFSMLQTIREYSVEQLDAAGERDRLAGRHADFYREVVIDGARRLRAGEMGPVMELHMADGLNIQAALHRYLDYGDGDAAAEMGMACWPVWFSQGRYSEGEEAMQRALSPGVRLSDAARADATLVFGLMIFERGEYDRSFTLLQPVLDQYVELGEPERIATASIPIGVVRTYRDQHVTDGALTGAVDLMRRIDDRWGLGFALLALGTVLVVTHREAEAIEPLQEGTDIARNGSEEIMLSNALISLGWARMGQRDMDGAKASLWDGLQRAVAVPHQESAARALDGIAAVAGRTGDPSDGAILLGAADALRQSVDGTVWAIDRASHDETADLLNDRLGADTFENLNRHGHTLALDDVLAMASNVRIA